MVLKTRTQFQLKICHGVQPILRKLLGVSENLLPKLARRQQKFTNKKTLENAHCHRALGACTILWAATSVKWTRAKNYSGNFSDTAFEQVMFNDKTAYILEPMYQSRTFFMQYPDTPFWNLCEMGANYSCVNIFCNGNAMNVTNRQDYSRAVNYCYYCATYPEFEWFRSNLNTCNGFPKMFNSTPCTLWFHFGSMLSVNTSANSPYLCFCPDMGKFGTECDAYPAFFHDLSVYGSSAVICIPAILLLCVFVIIPDWPGL